jgi:O-antigen/teichoic acid export membrane protein
VNADFISKAFSSPIMQYMGVRYVTYGLQFLNAILIAKYLGVYYFGIYSFLQLVKQYLLYTGIPPSYSLNAILPTCKSENERANSLWQNALLLTVILIGCAFLIGIATMYYYPQLFFKYKFNDYSLLILLIFSLNSFNYLFVSLYRNYGLLKKINVFELITPLFQFIVLFIAREKELIYFLLIATFAAHLIALIIFIYKPPLNLGVSFEKKIFKELFVRGFHLLLFNVSFSLILISSRTIVSIYYSAEDLGYYTFAVNLSSAVFMIVGAFGFLIYPKLLYKIHKNNNVETKQLLDNIRSMYMTSCYLLTYVGFFSMLLFEYFLPAYMTAMPAFKILLLTQLILNNTFGYSMLLVSKKKEKVMTTYAILAMMLIVLISSVFILLKFSFIMISIAVSIGFVFYCLKIISRSFRLINHKSDLTTVLLEVFPYYYSIPLLILALAIFFNDNLFIPLVSLIVFLFMNKKIILDVYYKILNLVKDKESLNF